LTKNVKINVGNSHSFYGVKEC